MDRELGDGVSYRSEWMTCSAIGRRSKEEMTCSVVSRKVKEIDCMTQIEKMEGNRRRAGRKEESAREEEEEEEKGE